MKRYFSLIILALVFVNTQWLNAQSKYENQEIDVAIDIAGSILAVKDQITLPDYLFDKNDKSITFYLNKNLTIEKVEGAKIENLINEDTLNNQYVNKYQLKFKKSNNHQFTIHYKGIINDQIRQSAAEYARGFSETKGIISEKGIYMANATYWLPTFNKNLLSTFNLNVEIDKKWSIVSQGDRTKNEIVADKKLTTYYSPEPMDEVYLIGAKWTEYAKKLGDIEVQVFLRTPDQQLADRYLNVTSGYLQMYNTLIGDYPYTKFALVENFWETGYGMPSFTLLGEKVIRFPWILFSSYPHELLHNYWGNSVFVNYDEGNWCEGVTAYMADHLMQEQRGSGTNYRRNTLQKFTDYVNTENDFPINQFLNRNNSAEEAIGYGKVLMVNNMLRDELGDEIFVKAYQKFYKDNKFKKVSFPEIQKSFEEVSGKDLSSFFKQWIDRKGAPGLEISKVSSKGNQLTFTLKQTQSEDVFKMNIPIVIFAEGNNDVVWKRVAMHKKEQKYTFDLAQKPLRVEVDPQFNVMRRLDRKEVPSSLSQVFGETKSTIIVPANSKSKMAYQKMAETWKATQESQGKSVTVVNDTDIKNIPMNQSVWILGYNNKFYGKELKTIYKGSFDAAKLELIKSLEKSGALVYAIPNTNNTAQSVGFVGANSNAAITALTRKLLHYGKYGYLGFEGDAAKNVLKGSLPALDSPLNVKVNEGKVTAKLIPRKALYQSNKRQGRPKH